MRGRDLLAATGIMIVLLASGVEEGRELQMLIMGVLGMILMIPALIGWRREERRREREDKRNFHRRVDTVIRGL